MRSAEEIIEDVFPEGYSRWMFDTKPVRVKFLKELINEARKEAIEECAERAKPSFIHTAADPRQLTSCSVDKQSILSLIKELQ